MIWRRWRRFHSAAALFHTIDHCGGVALDWLLSRTVKFPERFRCLRLAALPNASVSPFANESAEI